MTTEPDELHQKIAELRDSRDRSTIAMVPDVLQRDDLDPDDRERLERSSADFVAAKAKHDASIAYYRETFGPDAVPPDADGYEEARAALDKSLKPIIDPTIDDTLRALARKLYPKGTQ